MQNSNDTHTETSQDVVKEDVKNEAAGGCGTCAAENPIAGGSTFEIKTPTGTMKILMFSFPKDVDKKEDNSSDQVGSSEEDEESLPNDKREDETSETKDAEGEKTEEAKEGEKTDEEKEGEKTDEEKEPCSCPVCRSQEGFDKLTDPVEFIGEWIKTIDAIEVNGIRFLALSGLFGMNPETTSEEDSVILELANKVEGFTDQVKNLVAARDVMKDLLEKRKKEPPKVDIMQLLRKLSMVMRM